MKIAQMTVGAFGVNCYIVFDEQTKEAIVIDPGDQAEEILSKLAAESLSVNYIVNTHGHADHIGANRMLKEKTGAKIAIHELDAPMLTDAKLNLSAFMGGAVLSDAADIILKDGDTIDIGGEALTVIHTPGHTKGGVCLLLGDMLFSGDTLFAESVGRCDFPGGDMRELVDGIQNKLMKLSDSVRVFPGHGPGTSIGRERTHNPYIGA